MSGSDSDCVYIYLYHVFYFDVNLILSQEDQEFSSSLVIEENNNLKSHLKLLKWVQIGKYNCHS